MPNRWLDSPLVSAYKRVSVTFPAYLMHGQMPTSLKTMSQLNVTWSEGAVPPRFGYFVEGQSNSRGRRPRRV